MQEKSLTQQRCNSASLWQADSPEVSCGAADKRSAEKLERQSTEQPSACPLQADLPRVSCRRRRSRSWSRNEIAE